MALWGHCLPPTEDRTVPLRHYGWGSAMGTVDTAGSHAWRRWWRVAIAISLVGGATLVMAPPRVGAAGAMTSPATAGQLATALDIPSGQLVNASLQGSDPQGVGVFTGPLSGLPTKNGSFAILSTGRAA